jgi:starch-binding outer membrane protein, SusD/RagB family
MKTLRAYMGLTGCAAALAVAACDEVLSTEPPNGMSPEVALSTPEGLAAATLGNYRNLLGNAIDLHRITEFGSDEVMYCCTTTSALFNLYTYIHTPNLGNVRNVWRRGYTAIYGANQVIENVKEGTSAAQDQLLGENYLLRAYFHFFLVRVFGRPYPQGRDNPGVPIRQDTDPSAQPERATVGAVYDLVVADLLKAAQLMTVSKANPFASKEVAYALLSRVYLYMENNAKAVEYANLVLASNRYQMTPRATFMTWPKRPPEQNPEIIWVAKWTIQDDAGSGNPGYIYYRTPAGVGFGEMYASTKYWDLINQHPNDGRLAFIEPQRDASGSIVPRLGVPQLFVNKMVGQEGIATLGSPVLIRLAEVYLNRAEANAKLGNAAAAVADVNVVRQRAGLTDTALYTAANLKGRASVLDVVLEERLLELAWEGHRQYDLFRNGRTLFRNYPGTHLLATAPGADLAARTQTIPANHPRVVHFIPEAEIQLNPKLTQNP